MSQEKSVPDNAGSVEHELTLIEDEGRFDRELRLWMAGRIMPAVDPDYGRPPDDPDGGELARLIPPHVPPNIGSIALREPREQLLTLTAA